MLISALISVIPFYPVKKIPISIPHPGVVFGRQDKPIQSPMDFDRETRRKKRKRK